MLDFNLTEMAVVAVIALLVIGPKDLPKALRVVGYWIGKARGVARQFRAGFDDMVREAEIAEMEKKWQEENERIMREHPLSPAKPLSATDAGATDTVDTAGGEEQPTAPVMVERPVVLPAPDHGAASDDRPADRAAS